MMKEVLSDEERQFLLNVLDGVIAKGPPKIIKQWYAMDIRRKIEGTDVRITVERMK